MEGRIDLLNDGNVRDEMFKYFWHKKNEFASKERNNHYDYQLQRVAELYEKLDIELKILLDIEHKIKVQEGEDK